MTEQLMHQQPVGVSSEVVRHLLRQHPVEPMADRTAVLAGQVAALERQAPEFVRAAKEEADVTIAPLGVHPLPPGPMYYTGPEGMGWVLTPATTADDAVVPRREAKELRQLHDAGIYFPKLFVAHEIQPELAERVRARVGAAGLELDPTEAAELVGPIPPPVESVALGERMTQRSQQVVAGLRRTGQLAVRTVALPAVAAGAVLTEIATLDPVVIGAVPLASERPGAPASWFGLVAWAW